MVQQSDGGIRGRGGASASSTNVAGSAIVDAPLGESDNPPRFGDGGEAVYVALTNVPGTETGFAMSDEERVLFSASVCSFYYNCMYVFVYVFSGP